MRDPTTIRSHAKPWFKREKLFHEQLYDRSAMMRMQSLVRHIDEKVKQLIPTFGRAVPRG